jgi:hypothetical protein
VTRTKAARYLVAGDQIGQFVVVTKDEYTEPGSNWWGGKTEVPMVRLHGISILFGTPIEDWYTFTADALVTYTPAPE